MRHIKAMSESRSFDTESQNENGRVVGVSNFGSSVKLKLSAISTKLSENPDISL